MSERKRITIGKKRQPNHPNRLVSHHDYRLHRKASMALSARKSLQHMDAEEGTVFANGSREFKRLGMVTKIGGVPMVVNGALMCRYDDPQLPKRVTVQLTGRKTQAGDEIGIANYVRSNTWRFKRPGEPESGLIPDWGQSDAKCVLKKTEEGWIGFAAVKTQ